MSITRIILTSILCLLFQAAHAQVSIGKIEAPVEGALLELSEGLNESGSNHNSEKGMMLPRVQLISPSELYPMFEDIDDKYNTQEKREEQKIIHTGLIVYVPEIFSTNKCPGPYIWTGTEWNPLLEEEKENQSIFTDAEGNQYHYKQFGSLLWFTNNLRTLTVNGEGVTPLAGIMNSRPGVGICVGKRYLTDEMLLVNNQADIDNIGMHTYIINKDKIKLSMNDFVNHFGLQYNYEQAREACPTGWRLPTQPEWDELYSEVQAITGLSASEAGIALKNDKSIYGLLEESQDKSWSGPDPCDENIPNVHFNALPAGAGNWISEHGWHFGDSAFWWIEQGTKPSEGKNLIRYALKYNTTVLGTDNLPIDPRSRYSIRCVKDAY